MVVQKVVCTFGRGNYAWRSLNFQKLSKR